MKRATTALGQIEKCKTCQAFLNLGTITNPRDWCCKYVNTIPLAMDRCQKDYGFEPCYTKRERFDPYNNTHLKAYNYLLTHGVWPPTFKPRSIVGPVLCLWRIERQMARHWAEYILRDLYGYPVGS